MIDLFGSKKNGGKKWDVSAKKLSDGVPEYDSEKCTELSMRMTLSLNTLMDNGEVTRICVAKYIHDNAHDPNVCVVLSDLVALGLIMSQTDFFISASEDNPTAFRALMEGQEESTKATLRAKIKKMEGDIESLLSVIEKL